MLVKLKVCLSSIITQAVNIVQFLIGLFYQPESSMYHMILSTVYQAKFWEVYQIVGSKKGMVSMRDFLLMMMVKSSFIVTIFVNFVTYFNRIVV